MSSDWDKIFSFVSNMVLLSVTLISSLVSVLKERLIKQNSPQTLLSIPDQVRFMEVQPKYLK